MAEFPETNPSLIARLQELGDGTSWAEFLRLYEPVVYRIARRRGLQEADAQDVVQQVFVSISRSIEDWHGGLNRSPFRAWLTAIARNATVSGDHDATATANFFDRYLARMTSEDAADVIINGDRKNKTRILVGTDAKFLDLWVRLVASKYQWVMAKGTALALTRAK